MIVLCCHHLHDNSYELQTKIMDTGIGISKGRQMTLFKPFLELMMKQSLNDVQSQSIGMGLACSQIITRSMNGRVKLNHSEKGLTSISVTLPFKVEDQGQIVERHIPEF